MRGMVLTSSKGQHARRGVRLQSAVRGRLQGHLRRDLVWLGQPLRLGALGRAAALGAAALPRLVRGRRRGLRPAGWRWRWWWAARSHPHWLLWKEGAGLCADGLAYVPAGGRGSAGAALTAREPLVHRDDESPRSSRSKTSKSSSSKNESSKKESSKGGSSKSEGKQQQNKQSKQTGDGAAATASGSGPAAVSPAAWAGTPRAEAAVAGSICPRSCTVAATEPASRPVGGSAAWQVGICATINRAEWQ